MRSKRALLPCIALVLFACAVSANVAAEDDTKAAFLTWRGKINLARDAGDAATLEGYLTELKEAWSIDSRQYVNLLTEDVYRLLELDAADSYRLCYAALFEAFEHWTQRPHSAVEEELKAAYVMNDLLKGIESVVPRIIGWDGALPEGGAAVRARHAKAMALFWEGVAGLESQLVEVEGPVYFSVPPPDETSLPPGVAPEAVKDPALRAEYEARIRENSWRAVQARLRSALDNILRRYLERRKGKLTDLYTRPPEAVAELEALLADAVLPPGEAESLLAEVKAHWAALERESNQPAEAGEGAQEQGPK